jgi:hypothetical protein
MENKIHPDIKVKFDKFDVSLIKKVDLCDLVDNDSDYKTCLKPSDGLVLYNLFSKTECSRIIETTEKFGYELLIGYNLYTRNNDRIKCNSTTIINEI